MLQNFFENPLNRALFASLLGLFALLSVILIYLIKSKYVPKTVSSTFIWKRSLKHMKRRVPINFIISALLIVQILVVIIAALSLGDIHFKPGESQATIVVVDASASMNAKNDSYKNEDGESKTRYEVALDKIKAAAEKVGPNSGMSIIIAGEYPEVLTITEDKRDDMGAPYNYVYSKEEVVEVVNDYLVGNCTNVETDINAALAEAKTAIYQNSEAKIILYTDRMYAYNDIVEIVNCADPETDWNAGITTFTDENLAAGYEYTANIINEGKEAEFVVSLTVDGSVVATKKIAMGKGETRRIVFSPRSTNDPEIIKIKSIKKYEKAKIEINTSNDIFDDDNIAYLAAVPKTDFRVLYVSDKLTVDGGSVNTTHQTQLQLSLGANGVVVSSENIYHSSEIKKAPTSGYDLYIYEGTMPLTMPEDGAVWFINAPSSPVGTNITFSDVVKDASKDGSGGYILEEADIILGPIGQQLTNNVEFDEPVKLVINGELKEIPATVSKMTVIGKVDNKTGEVQMVIPENFETIYNCKYIVKLADGGLAEVQTPVMLAGKVGTTRTIVTTFDFSNSSLPIFIADYPVLLKNMLDYSMPDVLPERTPTIGDELVFNAPAGVEKIVYYYKSYETQIAEDKGDIKASNGREIGKWEVSESIEPGTVILDQLGIYNIVVTYKAEVVRDEDGEIIENAQETETFAVSTYMPLTESDINARGPKLSVPAKTSENNDLNGRSYLWIFVLIFIIIVIVEWGVYYRDEY